jgi:hypothetical protein
VRKNGGDTDEHTNLDTTIAKPTKRYYNAKGAKVDNTIKVAKHPPNPPRWQSNMETAAKHPPEQNGGKVSANE